MGDNETGEETLKRIEKCVERVNHLEGLEEEEKIQIKLKLVENPNLIALFIDNDENLIKTLKSLLGKQEEGRKQKRVEEEENNLENNNNSKEKVDKTKSLLNVRVLDLSHVLAGPYCTMLLADMGADVIKIEKRGKGDDSRQFPPFKEGQSLYFTNLNRGKRSIELDLKSSEIDRQLFLQLVETSDILVENFSPGTMKKLGFDYETLKKINPKIVYASISGFGQFGPYCERPGYDVISQAMSGIMDVTGWEDSPPTRCGAPIGDITAALHCCVGILSALHIAEKTGQGQMIDIALVDSLFATLAQITQKMLVSGQSPKRIGNRYEFIYPYDSFQAADGWVVIGIANDVMWERFLSTAKPTLQEEEKERFSTNAKRLAEHVRVREIVETWTKTLSVTKIVDDLSRARIAACPIRRLKDVAQCEQVCGAREMLVDVAQGGNVGTVRLLGNAVKMSATQPKPRGRAPDLGEHTDEVRKMFPQPSGIE